MREFTIIFILLVSNFFVFAQTKIEVRFIDGFTDIEKEIVIKNISKLEKFINSKDFENLVINAKPFKRNRIKNYSNSKKYSNREVLELIRSGKEFNTKPDSIITLKLILYDSEKNEIGHTDGLQQIHTYRDYFKKNSNDKYLSHLLHEYCHVIGFRHSFLRLPYRNRTVPYAIGNIAEKFFINN